MGQAKLSISIMSSRPEASGGRKSHSILKSGNTCKSPLSFATIWFFMEICPRLDIFMLQKERPQFYFDLRRFWQSLSADHHGPRPEHGLLNTMYLLACYWSGDSGLTALQPHFLARARKHQSDALGEPTTNMLQWIQASTMLAYYLAAGMNRFLEARQEVSCGGIRTRPGALLLY